MIDHTFVPDADGGFQVDSCVDCGRSRREHEQPRGLRSSNQQLLPCPFCGGPARLEFDEGRHHNEERKEEHRWQVLCDSRGEDCPVYPMTHCTSKDEAVRQWNTRATPNNIPGVLVLSDEEFDAITRQPDETE